MTKIEQERDFPPPSPGPVLKARVVGRLGICQADLAEALIEFESSILPATRR